MRSRLVRFLSLASLMFALQFLNLGCSSSSSGEGQGEEVAANEEGTEEGANNNAAAEEDGQAAANNDGNALANGAEGGENNQQAGNAENNGLNDAGNGLADNNQGQGQGGGEEDLQQIIEEMNTASNTQLPPANNSAAGSGFDTTGNASGFGNAVSDAGSSTNQASASTGSAPAGAQTVGTPAGPGLPELGSKMSYIVQKGDTLAKIASRIYGDSNKWTEIANFTGLANPRLIYPGDVVYYQLTEQSMNFAGVYDSMKRSEVQIQQGDTLATIAGRVFGNSSLWKLIWRQNDRIDNPDRLTAGSTIYYVDPASTASVDQKAKFEFVKTKSPSKADGKLVSYKTKNIKPAVYEVANDHLDDLFSQTVSKDLLKRT